MTELYIPQSLESTILVATDTDRAIGKDNKIPWKHKGDMKFFKETTLTHIVLMGRKTFESMGSKPLPYRHNIVLSSQLDNRFHDELPLYPDRNTTSLQVVDVLAEAIEYAASLQDLVRMSCGHRPKLFVIGGQAIYEALLPYVDTVMHNVIETRIEGADTYFPEMSEKDWFLASHATCTENLAPGDLSWRQQVFVRRAIPLL